jgi:methionyl-tRNA formyltransferase
MSNIELVKAKYSDVDLLFELDNDLEYRKNSFNSDQITYREHLEWFKKKMLSETTIIYICMKDGIPIGVVRIELNSLNNKQKVCELSYILGKSYRGQGYSRIIIALLEQEILNTELKKYPLYAKVKKKNIASQKIFEGLEYKKEEFNEFYSYEQDKTRQDKTRQDKTRQDKTRQLSLAQNYESQGILFLTNNENFVILFDWLFQTEKVPIFLYSEKLYIEQIKHINIRMIISYNYDYLIEDEIINFINGNIINLHISFLSWNRGFSPNFWSFIDNTPKGVTIHRIDQGLDTGDIIVQKELFFDEDQETFKTSYDKLNQEIVELFKDNWEMIKSGNYVPIKQEGNGTYHNKKQLKEHIAKYHTDWNENIAAYKKRIGL